MEYIKNIGERIKTRGPHPVHEGGGTPTPLGAPSYLVGPLAALRRQLQLHILAFGEKKIIEKKSSRFTIWGRRQALISLGRADLESVRDSREGDSSPSSSSTILHHPPPCVSNSIVGLLDGDGLDEIYQVIQLVLLGFYP